MDFLDTVKQLVGGTADAALKHNNANKAAERIPVQRDMVAGECAKHIALEEILPKHIAEAHTSGLIHYHDLDYAPLFAQYNCMLIDLKGMLEQGFKMGNAEIESPKSISTAAAVTAQIIAQVASHIYGGNSIDRIDEVLAPYVRKSYEKHHATGRRWFKGDEAKASVYATEMVEKETYDAIQGLEYEINTLHTANGQTPFCSFGLGLGTSWEARLIQKCIFQVRIAGLGKNKRTAIFPKLIYGIKTGLNRKAGDINYDIKQLALECAAKRMYPDILNYDKTVEITGGYKAPMGCRSFLAEWQNEKGESVYAGRMNLGVVSLNLPRIALDARGDEDVFWDLFTDRLDLAREALMTRIARLEETTADVAPILYVEGAAGMRLKPTDKVAEHFKNGYASISLGYIGCREMANAMFPDEGHEFDSEKKQQFIKRVVSALSNATKRWKQETGYGFGLYSTPSESLCGRFYSIDKERFGEVTGVTDRGYYTNSFHLDVEKAVSPFDKIGYETGFAELASGGHISYTEYPRVSLNHQIQMLEIVWDYSYDKVPYLGANIPIDECFDCGWQGDSDRSEEGFTCPHCGGNNISVTKRVCGYLGSPDSRPFNPSKQREVVARVKHHQ